LVALIGTLAVSVVLRTGIHLAVSTGVIRYGRHYEQLLVALLLLSPAVVSRKLLLLAVVAAILLPLSMMFGNTRMIIAGIVGVGGLATLVAFFDRRFSRQQATAIATASAILLGLAALALTGNLPGLSHRMNVASAPASQSYILVADASVEAISINDKELARLDWENALKQAGPLSIYDRIAEARYFLVAMSESPVSFWLGTGSGDSVTVSLGPNHERVVRGAHNTFATLLNRHGAFLGALLILFVSFYGLPKNLRQYLSASSAEWRIILAALIIYRLVIILLAQMHQGLFDDPIVFFGIAIAIALPTKIPENA
jgi:hypothetical protein